MSVSVEIKNACKILGEGPHWEEKSQSLLYVDIYTKQVNKWNSVTKEVETATLDGTVSLVVPCESGGYAVAQDKNICHLDWESRKVDYEYCEVDQGRDTLLNDGKCDPQGRLWFGTQGTIDPVLMEPIKEMGTLYSISKKGSPPKKHFDKICISNGIGWSPDGRTFYHTDSVIRVINAFDFDSSTGEVSNRRVMKAFSPDTKEMYGDPDGMAVDAEGKLWIACFWVGKVIKLDPETGTVLQDIPFPITRTTSCCFGGPDLRDLYVTSGTYGLSEETVRSKEALAGSLFKITGLGVRGLPVNSFSDVS